MAGFPTAVQAFTVKQDGVDYPQASHINLLQTEVGAIETALITGPISLPASTLASLSVAGGSTLAGTLSAGNSTLANLSVTGGSTFAGVKFNSTVSFGSSVTFATGITSSGTFKPVGLSSLTAIPTMDVSGYSLTLASGESTTIASFAAGAMIIYEGTLTGDVAWISVANNRTSIVHQTNATYSTVQNSTTKTNISVAAGTMTIQNQLGGQATYKAMPFKLN